MRRSAGWLCQSCRVKTKARCGCTTRCRGRCPSDPYPGKVGRTPLWSTSDTDEALNLRTKPVSKSNKSQASDVGKLRPANELYQFKLRNCDDGGKLNSANASSVSFPQGGACMNAKTHAENTIRSQFYPRYWETNPKHRTSLAQSQPTTR